jgi:hypothetical protein
MAIETKHYADGTSATGTPPLPNTSPSGATATGWVVFTQLEDEPEQRYEFFTEMIARQFALESERDGYLVRLVPPQEAPSQFSDLKGKT